MLTKLNRNKHKNKINEDNTQIQSINFFWCFELISLAYPDGQQ